MTKRNALVGLLLTACTILPGAASAPTAPTTEPSPITPGYTRMIHDLEQHWWDGRFKIPRIWPTRGANSSPSAHDSGTIDAKADKPSFWQMAQLANVFYWNWKITHAPAMKKKLLSQWTYLRSVYPDKTLASAARADGIVNVSDDAGWELNYLTQVHEVTGDNRALDDAVALLPNILNRFADPNAPRTHCGSLRGSLYGILYGTATDNTGIPNSTTYEVTLANAALYLHAATHRQDYVDYAISVNEWVNRYLKHPRGYYDCALDLRPTIDGNKNPHYLKPLGDEFGPPLRGHATSEGGTLGMAVLAARLYAITQKPEYLAQAREITDNYCKKRTFLRPGKLFVNARNVWTDAYWAPAFAEEVLPLPGADPTGLWKEAAHNTGLAILAQRTPDAYYGADWSGPELDPADGSTTWIEHAGKPNSDGMGLPNQVMTTANSASMVTAAEIIETTSHR